MPSAAVDAYMSSSSRTRRRSSSRSRSRSRSRGRSGGRIGSAGGGRGSSDSLYGGSREGGGRGNSSSLRGNSISDGGHNRETRSRSKSSSRSFSRSQRSSRRRRSGWDESSSSNDKPSSSHTTSAPSIPSVENLTSFSGGIGFSPSGVPALQPTSSLVSNPAQDTTGGVPTGSFASNTLAVAYQKRAMCRIYVGSLDYYLTIAEIKQVFQAFGEILAVDMPKEGDRSKGFCFVEFANPESAEMALSAMQGFTLKGRTIKVGRPSAVGLPTPAAPNPPTIKAPGTAPIAPPAAASTLNPTQAGALAAAAILNSRSMGTIDINAVLQKAEGLGIPVPTQLPQQIKTADLPSTLPSPSRMYVGNVPASFTASDLEKIFAVFGNIMSCYLLPNNEVPGTHRGYGFIDFADPASAKVAIDSMNGFPVADKVLKVNYASSVRQPSPALLNSIASSAVSVNSPGVAVNTAAVIARQSAQPIQLTVSPSIVPPFNPEVPVGGAFSPPANDAMKAAAFPGDTHTEASRQQPPLSATGANRIPLGSAGVPSQFTSLPSAGGGVGSTPSAGGLGGIATGQFPPGGGNVSPQGGVASAHMMPIPGNLGNVYQPALVGSPVNVYDAQAAGGGVLDAQRGVGGSPQGVSSNVILMTNMVNPDEVDDGLKEEVYEECKKFGNVADITIFHFNEEVRIFVVYSTLQAATYAVGTFHGRTFGGRQIVCRMYSQQLYNAGNLTS